MFDLGLSEILLISVVSLVVLGPERLPKVARMAGHWLGRLQHFVANVKTELNTQSGMAEFRQAKDSLTAAAREFEHQLHHTISDVGKDLPDWDARPAWERLPEQRTPDDFAHATSVPSWHHNTLHAHQVSLRRQAMQRKRDRRPRHQARPQLRVRRHFLSE